MKPRPRPEAARRWCAWGLWLTCVAGAGCGSQPVEPAAPSVAEPSPVGIWRAVLTSPGGDLPFGLEVTADGETISAVVRNGAEEVPVAGVERSGSRVTLDFSWYDSRIVAELAADGDTMSGEWTRTYPAHTTRLPFRATKGEAPRFDPVPSSPAAEAPGSLAGTWEIELRDEDGTTPAVGELEQSDTGEVTGTFLTPTGDYRYLAGQYDDGLLRLSTFDGAHCFLFQARAQSDGSLGGDFWSRDTYHATWTARRATEPLRLPDPWSQVELTNQDGRFRFSFPDLEGRVLDQDDPRFAGRPLVINIFGSWCPNCNDEAPLLAEWHRRYRDRGLEMVGLAFEFTGNRERDRRMVARYASRHGIEFPLLLAGVSDKRLAGEALPDLSAVLAYPTTLFIGRDGRVRQIHSGFAGPGTGAHHLALVGELETAIEGLLEG